MMRKTKEQTRCVKFFIVHLLLFSSSVLGEAAAWTISGTVYGNGNPMPDATVNLYIASNGELAAQSTTAANGGYSLSAADGSYNMLVVPPDDISVYANSPINGIEVAGNDVTQDVLLVTGGSVLSGVVRLPDGTPVQGVQVTLYQQDGSGQVGDMKTGSDGVYTFSVTPGSYKYRLIGRTSDGMNFPGNPYVFELGGRNTFAFPNTVVAGTTTKDLMLPLAWLSGQTADSNGSPVGDVELQVSYAATVNGTRHAIEHIYGQTQSDAEGHYSMALLNDLSYQVTVIPPVDTDFSQIVIQDVVVLGDTVRDFTLPSSVQLSGVVRLPDGTPVQGVQVTLYQQDGSGQVGDMKTGSDGVYTFSVTPGSYKYRLIGRTSDGMNFPGNPYVFELGGRNTFAFPNTVVAGTTTKDLMLPLAWLSGQTADSNGSPVGDVELQVSYAATVNGTRHAIEHIYGQTQSDAEGHYSMALLNDLSYQVTVIPPGGSGFSQTVVNDMDIVGPSLFGVILQLPDLASPFILSGPFIDEVTDQTARVQWSTDEPATSAVRVNGTTYAIDGYRREHSVPVAGLAASTVYTAEVQSADEAGNDPATAAVDFETGVAPDLAAPLIIEGPVIVSIAHNSAVVEWRTNEPATTELDYGPGSDLSGGVSVAGLRDLHRVALTGLSADLTYGVQVRSNDAAGNGPVTSALANFSTLPAPDTKAPVITAGPLVININETEATVVWSTDEPAVSGVSLNDGTAYKVIRDENLVTEHEVRITGLAPDTGYEYTVSSTDGGGNGPTLSATQVFETLSLADADNPVVTEPLKIVGITHWSAVVHWRTDEPTDGVIFYGTSSDELEENEADAKLTKKHVVQLTGLDRDTHYFLKARSTDTAGNSVETDIASFTTRDLPDHGKPKFTKIPTVKGKTDTTVTIEWETDEPADSVVEYGEGTVKQRQFAKKEKTTKHSVTLAGLTPNTQHSFAVSCRDVAGNVARYDDDYDDDHAEVSPFRRLFDGLVDAAIQPAVAAGLDSGFVTEPDSDTTAPQIIRGPSVEYLTDSLAIITWATDEIATSHVRYSGGVESSEQLTGDITPTANHLQVLTNLEPGTGYSYQVASSDVAGNHTTSDTQVFTTPATPSNSPLSLTAAPASSLVTTSEALISATTNHYASCEVRFGVAPNDLAQRASVEDLATEHQVWLTQLTHNTIYYHQMLCADVTGGDHISNLATFQTAMDESADDDEDGINTHLDNCPYEANASQLDTDTDGVGDSCDSDDDNDDVTDALDAFPQNPDESVDTDGDGTGDNADLDDDADGLTDTLELYQLGTDPLLIDSDGDGMPDGFEVNMQFNPLSAADAEWDADGDRETNLQEYRQGTDPNDPQSNFRAERTLISTINALLLTD